jgi:hypothetical protein
MGRRGKWRARMKGLSIAGFIVAAILLALAPAASTIYREAYPDEAEKRAALAACAQDDPGFNRLFAGERARCYARVLQRPPSPTAPVPRSVELADIML